MGAVALLGAMAVLDATPASARCRAPVESAASGVFQNATQVVARSRWRNEVRRRYGLTYSRWGRAAGKVERCNKISPGRRWHCIARARPCS
jgi:hypothetical protein